MSSTSLPMSLFPSQIRSLAYGPDGLVVIGCNNGDICFYEPGADFPVRLEVPIRVVQVTDDEGLWESEPSERGAVLTVAFSPDGKRLASGGNDCELAVWDVATRSHLISLPFPDPIRKVIWSPQGERFLVVSGEEISVWSLSPSGTLEQEHCIYGAQVVDATWCLDGNSFAAVTEDGHFAIWDIVHHLDAFPPLKLADTPSTVTCTFGNEVAVGTKTGAIHLFSPEGLPLTSHQLGEEPIGALGWASTLNAVTACTEHSVRMLSSDNKGDRSVSLGSDQVLAFALSADGQRIVLADTEALRFSSLSA